MKKIIPILILSFLLISLGQIASAQSNKLPSPGLTPDSPFYFLKIWKEKIQLFFTFGEENKAKQHLHLADVRLAEYQKMVEKGKTEIAQKTLEKYEKQLDHALEKAGEAERKGEDVEKLKETISEKILKHQEVLRGVLEKVPEQAKEGIEKAIEASKKGYQTVVEAVSKIKEETEKREKEKEAEALKTKAEGQSEEKGQVKPGEEKIVKPGEEISPAEEAGAPVEEKKTEEKVVPKETVPQSPQETPAVTSENFSLKGYWFYSLIFSDQAFLISTPTDLKNSGVNLVSIAVPAKIDGSGNVAYELGALGIKEAFLGRIETLTKRYHQGGLKVMLVIELTQVNNLNETAGDPVPFTAGLNMNNFDSLVLEVAEIAQKNGVEYFSPLNEPDRKLGSSYVDFSKNILPKVKDVFSGKFVLKGDNPNANVVGYDVLGISLSPETTDMTNYRNTVKQRIANLQQMKLQEIWVTEFGNWSNVSAFSESQKAESHRIVLEEALGKVSGIIVYEPSVRDNWQIKGTQVYDVIKEFYER